MLVVTAQGYPDLATRRFLDSLQHEFEQAVYVGDYDPHGVQIFLIYKRGPKDASNNFRPLKGTDQFPL